MRKTGKYFTLIQNIFPFPKKITNATINTDCILNETFEKLEANLIGKKFIKQELKELVNDSLTNPVIKEDIYLMLDSEK